MSRRSKPLVTFIVDTREQWPYEFTDCRSKDLEFGGMVSTGLSEGDYAVERDGELLSVRIERKSLSDYFGCVGRGRDRFERELERLAPYRSFLLIEATAEQVRAGCDRSLVSGEAAFGSAVCWAVRYGVSPIFAGSHRLGQAICQRLLEEFAKHNSLTTSV